MLEPFQISLTGTTRKRSKYGKMEQPINVPTVSNWDGIEISDTLFFRTILAVPTTSEMVMNGS